MSDPYDDTDAINAISGHLMLRGPKVTQPSANTSPRRAWLMGMSETLHLLARAGVLDMDGIYMAVKAQTEREDGPA